jgi:peptidoglycan/xylan/chitin deacetylase (PgdA/CDA1 family)
MIIELVGLPGSGKTALAEELRKQGVVIVTAPSRTALIYNAVLFWLRHPVFSLRLFIAILRGAPRGMRYSLFMNGYLGNAARQRKARALSRSGAIAVLDQGFFQLPISLGANVQNLLASFPRPEMLVVVTADHAVRMGRIAERGWTPRKHLRQAERIAWEEQAEVIFHSVIPLFEKIVRVYPYDGTQHPKEGATALMSTVGKSRSITGSVIRNVTKSGVALVSFCISRVARIFSSSPEVVVLMYHSIDTSGWKLSVSPRLFERQIQYLAEKNLGASLADAVLYAKGEKSLSRAVAVTFDDGYRDLLTTVLPILEKYQIPATVFVPSDLSVHTDPDGRVRLTREELQMLAQQPLVTIGSHAETHRKFPTLSPEEMRHEAGESATELERVVGKRPLFFAYPFGARSAEAERVVKDAGYEAGFGISEGTIHPGDNLFSLKRVQIDGTMSFLLFKLRLTSALDWNRRILNLFRGKWYA